MTLDTNTILEDTTQTLTQKSETRRLYTITLIVYLISIAFTFFQFFRINAWQILGQSAGMLLSLVLIGIALPLHNRGKINAAKSLVPFIFLAAYATGELFIAGLTSFDLISGLALTLLAYLALKPANKRIWGIGVFAFVIMLLVFGSMEFFPRYEISSSSVWFLALVSSSTLLAILYVWLQTRQIRIRTIRTRLLMILIGVSTIPILITTTTAVVTNYQKDTRQAENYLQAISILKQEQINSWSAQLPVDFDQLQAIPDFTYNANLLLVYSPTESVRAQIYNVLLTQLLEKLDQNHHFTSISLADLNGNIILSTDSQLEGTNVFNEPAFKNGKLDLYYSPVNLNENIGPWSFWVTKPIIHQGNERIGVYLGVVDTTGFTEIVSNVTQLGETGEAFVILDDRSLLTPLRDNPAMLIKQKISSPAIDQILTTKDNQIFRSQNYSEIPVIGSSIWLPRLEAYLVLEQATAEALAATIPGVIVNISLTVVVLAIAISTAIFFSRNISEPIRTLSQSTAKITRGELNYIEPIRREDEIGELSKSLSQMTDQLFKSTANLENIVADRTKALQQRANYLQATSQISHAITAIHNLDELLTSVTHLISESFGFYHVGIFIVDERREFAVLRAANSEGGWRMLAREHKLRVGEQGIVGFVTQTGQARIQQQVEGEDSVYYHNPDLPMTKSEMALPLRIGNEILGALDVQSTQETAFSDEDVSVLQVLAESVAVAIQNTRLFQQLQESLETERRIYGQLTQEAWGSLVQRTTHPPAFRSDTSGVQSVLTSESPLARQALKEGKTIQGQASPDGNYYPLAVPIKVRGGTPIAVIETQKAVKDGVWSADEIDILESVSEQLGMALENARLFEETQRSAQRERITADLSGKIWASTDVNNILQTAIRELGSALNVSKGTISLKLPEEAAPGQKKTDGAKQK